MNALLQMTEGNILSQTNKGRIISKIKEYRDMSNTIIHEQKSLVEEIKQLALKNYEVKVIKDTIYNGKRITTLVIKYPRYIHAQLRTHRVFSMNASSSRAIPTAKIIQNILDNTALPLYWGVNKPGMQPGELLNPKDILDSYEHWMEARDHALDHANNLQFIGAHKQIINRILEPYVLMETIITATEWNNFFELRCHVDAQDEIQHLANKIKKAIDNSTPENSVIHIPFLTKREDSKLREYKRLPIEKEDFASTMEDLLLLAQNYANDTNPDAPLRVDVAMALSSARCARVSFINHGEDKINLHKDVSLFSQLAISKPIHASPLEHQAIHTCTSPYKGESNLESWEQFRKFAEEN